MAVKKKESVSSSSAMADSRKASGSVISPQRAKAKSNGDAMKAKQPKMKGNNPQKLKSDEAKEAKQRLGNIPYWQQLLEVRQFLNEVWIEYRKISWPERSQVIRETISVLFLVSLITFFVWSFDLVVGKFIFAPLEHWGHLYGIGGSG